MWDCPLVTSPVYRSDPGLPGPLSLSRPKVFSNLQIESTDQIYSRFLFILS